MLKRDDLQKLVNHASDNVLSLYLRIDPAYRPNQNTPRAWEIYANNALKDVDDTDAIASHVHDFLEGYTPAGKSLVLFVDEDGIIQHFTLPISIENQHSYGAVDVVPLLWAIDEYERYLVVLVDSEEARFINAYLGNASNDESMQIDFDDYDFGNKQFIHANHSGTGQQGSGGDQFDDMKQAHIRRFHDDVAEQIRTVLREEDVNRVILGGNDKAAHQVRDLLHESVVPHVVDIVPIVVDANESSVADAIRDVATNYERAQEYDLVEDVISLAKSGGRGALAVQDVMATMDNQQVELLILPYPMEDENLARQLTLQALENGTDIELVRGAAANLLHDEEGIAARLYYAVPEIE